VQMGMTKNTLQWLPKWSVPAGAAVSFIIACLIITPVILNQFIPLNDYPFHLARIVILADLDNPVYSEFYKAGSFLLPNMAMDMVAVPLSAIVGAETASRIFVMLSLLVMLLGTMLLHQAAHRRFSPWPLLAVLFLFNGIFRYGFLNYIFGLGVAFMAVAAWLWMKPSALKITVALILSLLLIMLHFAAFAVFAVIVGSCEIHAAYAHWRDKGFKASILKLCISAFPFLLAIAVFLIVSPTADVAAEGIAGKGFEFKPLGAMVLGGVYSLLTGIVWLDLISYSLLILIFAVFLSTGRIKIAPNLLLAFSIMTITYVLMPPSIMGSHFADVRLGPAIALLWVASIDIKAEYPNSNRFVAGIALVLSVLISVGVTKQWSNFNNEISTIARVFEKTEVGATIFSATAQPYTRLIADSPERRAAWSPPLKHVSSYAVLSGTKFVPMTFVDPTKQPLNVTEKYQSIKAFQTDNPRKTFTAIELEQFILEIKNHAANKDWPPLENVYVLVMGFDRIKESFNESTLGDSVQITEFNKNHALIKLQ